MLTEAARAGKAMKCVYMAPTKALCSERYRDWTGKFDALGIKCEFDRCLWKRFHRGTFFLCIGCELTGDTVQFGKGVWGDAKTASIMSVTHTHVLYSFEYRLLISQYHYGRKVG
jgi:ATP-dependent DNA helicase HFM1/MER3